MKNTNELFTTLANLLVNNDDYVVENNNDNTIMVDGFDHMYFVTECDNDKMVVEYFNRPTLKTDYAKIFEVEIEYLRSGEFLNHSICIIFMYNGVKYRLFVYNDGRLLIQVFDSHDNIVDFDDIDINGYHTISQVYNHVVIDNN